MQRLSKYLASCGISSRRKAEEIILEKRVKVNGKTIILPQTLINPQKDKIFLDNLFIKQEKKVYFILNKPKGYLCTNISNKKKVIDLFPKKPRVFTVGRLDKETTGLLIVTNDGLLANIIMHPSHNIEKEYVAILNREITKKDILKIKQGAFFEKRRIYPKKVQKIKKNILKITVLEGKKHEVRIFIKKANFIIKNLQRIRIGFLVLKDLSLGTYKKMDLKKVSKFLSLKKRLYKKYFKQTS